MTTSSVDEFEDQRSRLFGIAYRMLGSAAEAEDVVQDAFLRWNGADRAEIERPSAWLAKVVTNLCLNQLASARVQRETYVGPWLPEPVPTRNGSLGPDDTVEQRESVSMALLLLLERLTPTERAVFVLREAFAYSHGEVAEILSVSVANSRQLHRRALQRVDDSSSRFRPDPQAQRRLIERFLAAAGDGQFADLERLLAEDVTSYGDGGGKATAARRPVYGRQRVARLFVGFVAKYLSGLEVQFTEVNGEVALAGWDGDTLAGVMVFETSGDQITALRTVANPDKLRYLTRQLSRS